jgi:hypothetical protein
MLFLFLIDEHYFDYYYYYFDYFYFLIINVIIILPIIKIIVTMNYAFLFADRSIVVK